MCSFDLAGIGFNFKSTGIAANEPNATALATLDGVLR